MQRSLLSRVAGVGQAVSRSCSPNASPLKVARPLMAKTAPCTHQSRCIASNNEQKQSATVLVPKASVKDDSFSLVEGDLGTMFADIHNELEQQLSTDSKLAEMSQYYFDGAGKAVRPVVAMCVGHAYNQHVAKSIQNKINSKTIENQRKVAIISEMIHTASLVHDDILDHAETRRGKESINVRWDIKSSVMCGDYILSVGARLLAQIGDKEVVIILSQVLADLVKGEFMQLQNKDEESERFQHYLTKSFNKTASLMAYSCRANAALAGAGPQQVDDAFSYGRNIGIAFQLVDDLLDFVSSSDQLGKPAAADLQLGLATAPVLFATEKFPHLNQIIARRFSMEGDVEVAFDCVLKSGGLDKTRELARKHCDAAVLALRGLEDSRFKVALIGLADQVINRIK